MDKQKQLTEAKIENDVLIYSKNIQEENLNDPKILSNDIEKKRFWNIVTELMIHSKNEPKFMKNLNLGLNMKILIKNILNGFPNIKKHDVEFLINDFIDHMSTRSREKDKFIISVIKKNAFLICHTELGNQSIDSNFEIFDRILDGDIIQKFVYFEKKGDVIQVQYFEKTKSELLIKWLGLKPKDANYYLGGKNRFTFNFNDMLLSLEFNDNNYQNIFMKNKFEIKNGHIILDKPISSLPLNEIYVGRKKIKSIEDFNASFMERIYNVGVYKEKYLKIKNSLDYHLFNYEDCENYLLENEIEIVEKNKDFTILFSNNDIKLNSIFLENIFQSFLNQKDTKIFHAGLDFSDKPIKLRNLLIFNKLNVELSQELIKIFNNTEFPKSFENLFLYLIIKILIFENHSDIQFFLKEFSNKILINLTQDKKILLNENNFLEFKNSDFIAGNQKSILSKIQSDIDKKLKLSSSKFYIFGFDEKSKSIDPILTNKFSDDRIEELKKSLEEKYYGYKIEVNKFPLEDNRYSIITLLILKSV